jgi:hypothetical protein
MCRHAATNEVKLFQFISAVIDFLAYVFFVMLGYAIAQVLHTMLFVL